MDSSAVWEREYSKVTYKTDRERDFHEKQNERNRAKLREDFAADFARAVAKRIGFEEGEEVEKGRGFSEYLLSLKKKNGEATLHVFNTKEKYQPYFGLSQGECNVPDLHLENGIVQNMVLVCIALLKQDVL